MEQNIWALEKYPEDLHHVLKSLKKHQGFNLYTNLLCEFKLGNKSFKTSQFHTALETKEGIILFSKDEALTKKDILNEFKGLNCHITTLEDELELDDSDFTLDFVHSIKMLEKK